MSTFTIEPLPPRSAPRSLPLRISAGAGRFFILPPRTAMLVGKLPAGDILRLSASSRSHPLPHPQRPKRIAQRKHRAEPEDQRIVFPRQRPDGVADAGQRRIRSRAPT